MNALTSSRKTSDTPPYLSALMRNSACVCWGRRTVKKLVLLFMLHIVPHACYACKHHAKKNPTKREPGGVEGKQEEMTTGEPAV